MINPLFPIYAAGVAGANAFRGERDRLTGDEKREKARLKEQRNALAEAILAQNVLPPDPQRFSMRPGAAGALLLGGLLGNVLDKASGGTGQAGTAGIQGFLNTSLGMVDQANQAQAQRFQAEQAQRNALAQIAGLNVDYAQDDYRNALGALTRFEEGVRDNQVARINQDGLNYRAGLGVERANLSNDRARETQLLKGVLDPRSGPESRALAAKLLREEMPDRYDGLTDEQIAQIAKTLSPANQQQLASANLSQTRAEDIVLTRPARLAKIGAETSRIFAQADKLGADAAFVRKKTDLYDDEFAVRAANTYSQIEARKAKATGAQAGTITTKDIEAQIKDHERIARLAKANLKTMRVWDATAGVYMPRPGVKPETIAELEQEIINANNAAMQLSTDLAEIRKAQRSPQQGPPKPDRLPGRGEWETGGNIPPMPLDGLNVNPNPPAPQKPRTPFDSIAEVAKSVSAAKPQAKPKPSPSNRGASPLQRAIQGSQETTQQRLARLRKLYEN